MWREYLKLIRWDKPIGSFLLLWSTWSGLWLAYQAVPPLSVLLVFTLGVFLTRAAGCVINDYADIEFDGKVLRTATRPLVTGTIPKRHALYVMLILSVLALCSALMVLKMQTLLLAIPALLILVTYPYFKRFFPLPQLYLGLAFSFGILMAFVEARGKVPLIALCFFMANVLWVFAYDTIYALVDLNDDLKIKIKTSALSLGNKVVLGVMLSYLVWLGILLALGLLLHFRVVYYLSLALIALGLYQIYLAIKDRKREQCFKAFLSNNRLGLIMFLGIALNYGFN